jgi:hypothetical protein
LCSSGQRKQSLIDFYTHWQFLPYYAILRSIPQCECTWYVDYGVLYYTPGWNLSVIHSFEAESNKFQSLTFETRLGNLESTVLWRRSILKFFSRICKHKCDSNTCVDTKSFRALLTAHPYGVLTWRESQKLIHITSTSIVTYGRSNSFNRVPKRETNVFLMTFCRATDVPFLIKRACMLLWKYQISTLLEYPNLSLPENIYFQGLSASNVALSSRK